MPKMLEFDLPKNQSSIIKVIGVGGGGNNAVNHMFKKGIKDVDFINCNTDAQALSDSPVPTVIQLGEGGRGAGAKPDVGRQAAENDLDKIRAVLEKNTEMVFITAGMGGGTGTGAAPVIASLAKEMDILSVGIVTYPFTWEGRRRRLQADQGLEEMRKSVDTLLIINNNKIREIYGNQQMKEAFNNADDVLATAAKSIAEIITVYGYVNVDFEDVKEVMRNGGTAIMGTGVAEGENRAIKAVEAALSSPLLDNGDIQGARNILLYLRSGDLQFTLDEMEEITEYIQDRAGLDADIIWGNAEDKSLGQGLSVSLVATGFEGDNSVPEKCEERVGRKFGLNDKVNLSEGDAPAEPVKEVKSDDGIRLINPSVMDVNQHSESTSQSQSSERKPTATLSTEPVLFTKTSPTAAVENKPVVMRRVAGDSEEDILEREEMERRSRDRTSKLRNLSVSNLRDPNTLHEYESQPAYVRQKIKLDESIPSNETLVSRFSLNDDAITDNTYLHNKPD